MLRNVETVVDLFFARFFLPNIEFFLNLSVLFEAGLQIRSLVTRDQSNNSVESVFLVLRKGRSSFGVILTSAQYFICIDAVTECKQVKLVDVN